MMGLTAHAQQAKEIESMKKASRKLEKGFQQSNKDTAAQAYFDLGELYSRRGDNPRSEYYFKKSRDLFIAAQDAEGIARSSRALARVQEMQLKKDDAIRNYQAANAALSKNKSSAEITLNSNDIRRLRIPDSIPVQEALIQENIKIGLLRNDTVEALSGFEKMAEISLKNNEPSKAADAFSNAYDLSKSNPEKAVQYNQKLAEIYIGKSDISRAIEVKKQILSEPFVQQANRLKARELLALANLYGLNRDTAGAIGLLRETYQMSIQKAYTIEAAEAVRKLDSLLTAKKRFSESLNYHTEFLHILPALLSRDSSLVDSRLMEETEKRIGILESEKKLADDLIKRKNQFNIWLTGSLILLAGLLTLILFFLQKLKKKNRKIALQSLRREMNPHFIFNSLNSVNQFIANKSELEANRYITRFSTLMRRVMEQSAHDFIALQDELEWLSHYLELERSRFPDKFQYDIYVDDALKQFPELYVPVMILQPHIENAIWHGLRYLNTPGSLNIRFMKNGQHVDISIEDNGIGMASSRTLKTQNQQHDGRGLNNIHERIRILNQLYGMHMQCKITDKPLPEHGVLVQIKLPILTKLPV